MANTGYKIIESRDVNPYSSTWNQTKQEKVLDLVTCPSGLSYFEFDIEALLNNNNIVYYSAATLIQGTKSTVTIDWGDGTTSTIQTSANTINNWTNTSAKQYAQPGIYSITVEGADAPCNLRLSNSSTSFLYGNDAIVKIKNINLNINSENTISILQNLINLREIDDNFTLNITINQSYNKGIANFFKLSGYNYNLNWTSDIVVPATIFNGVQNNISWDVRGIFQINFLDNIPYSWIFNVNDMFDVIKLKIKEHPTYGVYVSNMFYGCYKITGEALPVINYLNSTYSNLTYSGMFHNCTSLSDYDSIPSDWK